MSFQDLNYKNNGRDRGRHQRGWRGRRRNWVPHHQKFNYKYRNYSNYNNYSYNNSDNYGNEFSSSSGNPSYYDFSERKSSQNHFKEKETRPLSPFPGSEEHTQRNIEKASDFIKKQLEIDENSSRKSVDKTDDSFDFMQPKINQICTDNSVQNTNNYFSFSDKNESSPKITLNKNSSQKSKPQPIYDVNEIHKKLISHISNLSHAKKVNIINQVGPTGYNVAVQQIQKQKRIELSQALRDMCKEQCLKENTETINSIIPDFDIPIENLPKEIIAKLSTSLNVNYDFEPEISNNESLAIPDPVDPETYFKQAENLLKDFEFIPSNESNSNLLNDQFPIKEDVTETEDVFGTDLENFSEVYQPSPQESDNDRNSCLDIEVDSIILANPYDKAFLDIPFPNPNENSVSSSPYQNNVDPSRGYFTVPEKEHENLCKLENKEPPLPDKELIDYTECVESNNLKETTKKDSDKIKFEITCKRKLLDQSKFKELERNHTKINNAKDNTKSENNKTQNLSSEETEVTKENNKSVVDCEKQKIKLLRNKEDSTNEQNKIVQNQDSVDEKKSNLNKNAGKEVVKVVSDINRVIKPISNPTLNSELDSFFNTPYKSLLNDNQTNINIKPILINPYNSYLQPSKHVQEHKKKKKARSKLDAKALEDKFIDKIVKGFSPKEKLKPAEPSKLRFIKLKDKHGHQKHRNHKKEKKINHKKEKHRKYIEEKNKEKEGRKFTEEKNKLEEEKKFTEEKSKLLSNELEEELLQTALKEIEEEERYVIKSLVPVDENLSKEEEKINVCSENVENVSSNTEKSDLEKKNQQSTKSNSIGEPVFESLYEYENEDLDYDFDTRSEVHVPNKSPADDDEMVKLWEKRALTSKEIKAEQQMSVDGKLWNHLIENKTEDNEPESRQRTDPLPESRQITDNLPESKETEVKILERIDNFVINDLNTEEKIVDFTEIRENSKNLQDLEDVNEQQKESSECVTSVVTDNVNLDDKNLNLEKNIEEDTENIKNCNENSEILVKEIAEVEITENNAKSQSSDFISEINSKQIQNSVVLSEEIENNIKETNILNECVNIFDSNVGDKSSVEKASKSELNESVTLNTEKDLKKDDENLKTTSQSCNSVNNNHSNQIQKKHEICKSSKEKSREHHEKSKRESSEKDRSKQNKDKKLIKEKENHSHNYSDKDKKSKSEIKNAKVVKNEERSSVPKVNDSKDNKLHHKSSHTSHEKKKIRSSRTQTEKCSVENVKTQTELCHKPGINKGVQCEIMSVKEYQNNKVITDNFSLNSSTHKAIIEDSKLTRKTAVSKLIEIDKEIDKLLKLRQSLYEILNRDNDNTELNSEKSTNNTDSGATLKRNNETSIDCDSDSKPFKKQKLNNYEEKHTISCKTEENKIKTKRKRNRKKVISVPECSSESVGQNTKTKNEDPNSCDNIKTKKKKNVTKQLVVDNSNNVSEKIEKNKEVTSISECFPESVGQNTKTTNYEDQNSFDNIKTKKKKNVTKQLVVDNSDNVSQNIEKIEERSSISQCFPEIVGQNTKTTKQEDQDSCDNMKTKKIANKKKNIVTKQLLVDNSYNIPKNSEKNEEVISVPESFSEIAEQNTKTKKEEEQNSFDNMKTKKISNKKKKNVTKQLVVDISDNLSENIEKNEEITSISESFSETVGQNTKTTKQEDQNSCDNIKTKKIANKKEKNVTKQLVVEVSELSDNGKIEKNEVVALTSDEIQNSSDQVNIEKVSETRNDSITTEIPEKSEENDVRAENNAENLLEVKDDNRETNAVEAEDNNELSELNESKIDALFEQLLKTNKSGRRKKSENINIISNVLIKESPVANSPETQTNKPNRRKRKIQKEINETEKVNEITPILDDEKHTVEELGPVVKRIRSKRNSVKSKTKDDENKLDVPKKGESNKHTKITQQCVVKITRLKSKEIEEFLNRTSKSDLHEKDETNKFVSKINDEKEITDSQETLNSLGANQSENNNYFVDHENDIKMKQDENQDNEIMVPKNLEEIDKECVEKLEESLNEYVNIEDTSGNLNQEMCNIPLKNCEENIVSSDSTMTVADQESLGEILFEDVEGVILVVKVVLDVILAASDKGKLFCYDLLYGKLLHTFNICSVAITSLCILKNKENQNLIYAGSLDVKFSVYNLETKEKINTGKVGEPIQCMEYAWGYLFIGSDRGSIIRYDVEKKKIEFKEKIFDLNVLVLRATLEGARKVLVVAARNKPVSVRDAMSGLLMRTMETPFCPTVYTLLLEKNLVFCGTSQHDILVYTFEDGQLIFKHEATKSKGVVCMQIVKNLLFAGCYNGNVYIYNIKTNKHVGTMNGPGGLLLSMEIVDKKIIVGTKSNKFKLWTIPDQYLKENEIT